MARRRRRRRRRWAGGACRCSALSGFASESRPMFAPVVYFAVAIAATIGDAGAVRVLGLFPHTGRSHQMVFEPLLHKLAERGHQVTVVSFFPLKNPPQNYTDVSLEGVAPIGLETVDVNFIDVPMHVAKYFGIDGLLFQWIGFYPLAGMALNVCQKLVHLPSLKETLTREYDVVLVENFSSDCILGLAHAYGLRAPKIAMSSCNLMPWSAERLGLFDNPAYTPLISTQYTQKMTLSQRIANTFSKYCFKIWYRYSIQMKEQELIENSLGKKIDDLQVLAKNISLMMTNVFHSLNGERELVPGLIEVGGMHLSATKKTVPRYMEDFLNESKEGVVLFSWGSLIKTSTIPPHKEEVIVRALSQLPQRVIWKYENSGPEGNLTGNILRVNWIPQYELLQHKKVLAFIAHGGLLGMTEAISAGKPMVVVPFFGDQPNNGAAAAAAGFGVVLPYADITEDSLLEALKKVLSPEFRLNARQASAIWHDRPAKPLDTAVYWVERVARWGDAAPLHHPARDMPFYQRALLDVIAVALAALIFVILLLRLVCKLLIKAIMSLFAKEKKKKVN